MHGDRPGSQGLAAVFLADGGLAPYRGVLLPTLMLVFWLVRVSLEAEPTSTLP